jgi:hypothetical protein
VLPAVKVAVAEVLPPGETDVGLEIVTITWDTVIVAVPVAFAYVASPE